MSGNVSAAIASQGQVGAVVGSNLRHSDPSSHLVIVTWFPEIPSPWQLPLPQPGPFPPSPSDITASPLGRGCWLPERGWAGGAQGRGFLSTCKHTRVIKPPALASLPLRVLSGWSLCSRLCFHWSPLLASADRSFLQSPPQPVQPASLIPRRKHSPAFRSISAQPLLPSPSLASHAWLVCLTALLK